nr:metallothionein [uncultured Halomonas sp.]
MPGPVQQAGHFIWISSTYLAFPLQKIAIHFYAELTSSKRRIVMANQQTCACPNCNCEVDTDQAVMSDGKAFCCDACASGHPDGAKCSQEGCGCDKAS